MIFKLFRKKEVKPAPKPIGLALFSTYTSCMGLGTTFYHPSLEICNSPGFGARDFHYFYKIDDSIEDNIKVNGCWLKKHEVLLFDSGYDSGYDSGDIDKFKNTMKSKYQIDSYTKIHQLYNDGLDIIHGYPSSVNSFHNKKLEKEIRADVGRLVHGPFNRT